MLLNRRAKTLFFVLIVIASLTYYLDFVEIWPNYSSFFLGNSHDSLYSDLNYLDYPYGRVHRETLAVDTPGCKIPDTYYSSQSGAGLKVPAYSERDWGLQNCPGTPYTFIKNGNILTLNREEIAKRRFEVSCCYNTIVRKSDDGVVLKEPCIPVINEEFINPPANFLQVTCKSLSRSSTEFHYIIHAYDTDNQEKISKLFTEVNSDSSYNSYTTKASPTNAPQQPSIIILGLDSVARQHMHQYMPVTRATLEKLGAIEFNGYNKVGENTQPNMIPLLTGYSLASLPCNHTVTTYIDPCPFIWHELNSTHLTGLLEDAPGLAIFNYKKVGFRSEPTNFYLRPLMMAVNEQSAYSNAYMFPCIGPRKTTETFMLQYVQDLLQYSNKQPLFLFTWMTSLAHENTKSLEKNDFIFSKFFKNVAVNHPDTVILFLSDHGYRYDSSSKNKRNSREGWFDEKLPFLFIKMPGNINASESARNKKILEVLRGNSRRLITPFDVHWTLREILQLPPPRGLNRTENPGQSLLVPISPNRTCPSAGIPPIFCSCTNLKPISLQLEIVLEAALASVSHINADLPGKCKKFQLDRITGAAILVNDTQNKTIELVIGFRAKPGHFDFESTVIVINNETTNIKSNSKPAVIHVRKKVLRTSPIESSKTWCCINDSFLELYCYCDFVKFIFWFYWW